MMHVCPKGSWSLLSRAAEDALVSGFNLFPRKMLGGIFKQVNDQVAIESR
jgi:hypothetical protein